MNITDHNHLLDIYGDLSKHQLISKIIIEHSTNRKSIESYAFKNLNYHYKIKIADIGCGYGRIVNRLNSFVPKGSKIFGFDIIDINKDLFIHNITKFGYEGEFINKGIDGLKIFDNGYFDLILCNYSLYFFPEYLPEIKRKLANNGIFISITHSKKSMGELLVDLKKVLKLQHLPDWEDLGSSNILDLFNAESGKDKLQKYFFKIEQIKYKNSLEFYEQDIDALITYLNFKKISLIHDNYIAKYVKSEKFDELLKKQVLKRIEQDGKYVLNKDDMIFRCINK